MKERIMDRIREIERSGKIRVLYACETGSRAWGFPSTDSDYDVRFIYMHERDWYLSLGVRKDTIDFPVADELDITGWDLRKCLTLLKKSNVPLIERFQSPVEYFSDAAFREDFKSLIASYYSPIAVFYHHYPLALKFHEQIKDERQVKLKGYFYLIRSLLSCSWVSTRSPVLPMHMEGLMETVDDRIRQKIRELILLKSTVDEKFMYTRDAELDRWMSDRWEQAELAKNDLKVNRMDYSLLDQFFLKILNTNADNRNDKG